MKVTFEKIQVSNVFSEPEDDKPQVYTAGSRDEVENDMTVPETVANDINTLPSPVRFSIFHQHFQTWIITSFTRIHLSVNITPQAIYINQMAT